jgi:predicted GIY-YIG superfamily endonuclease
MESAIHREKSLQAWKRLRKIPLIERANPEWRDLTPDIL